MNKSDLVNVISGKTTMTKARVKQVVDEVFEVISETLAREEQFKVIGFGTFEVTRRPSRYGRNPRTGEKIHISGRSVPVFSPGKKLLNAVNKKGKY